MAEDAIAAVLHGLDSGTVCIFSGSSGTVASDRHDLQLVCVAIATLRTKLQVLSDWIDMETCAVAQAAAGPQIEALQPEPADSSKDE